ncbi:MAG: M23 family metallopeptidase [Lysobacter sp.]|nr:MAG: M23 family metallopeptidase [Lysobacter sp.]
MNIRPYLIAFIMIATAPRALANCSSIITMKGSAPTVHATTHIRKGAGEYGAPREWAGPGKKHTGVDIVMNQSSADAVSYEVRSVAAGKVAYVRDNGELGNVVIVDHGDGCYSMYAHLANQPFTPTKPGGNAFVKLGQAVAAGQKIGYMRNIIGDTDPSGNAVRVGDPTARIQTHFSLFTAPAGKTSTSIIVGPIMASRDDYVDPTALLARLKYRVQ